MKKLALCFLLFFLSITVFAEQQTSPCLHSDAPTPQRIQTCLNWLNNYSLMDTRKVDSTIQLAHWLVDSNQAEKALSHLERLLKMDLEPLENTQKWTVYNYAAEVSLRLRNNGKALVYFKQAMLIADKDHQELLSAKTFLSLSNVLRKLAAHDLALEKAIDAYDIYFKYHETAGMADALVQLGNIYLRQNNIAQAEQAITQARNLYEIEHLSIGRATALILASRARFMNGDENTAKEHLFEASRALEAIPAELHSRVSFQLVREMLKVKLYDAGLSELSKLNLEQISDGALVHYLALESQIYLAKQDTSALMRIDGRLANIRVKDQHLGIHVLTERYKIAKALGNLDRALTFVDELTRLQNQYNRDQKQEVSDALTLYLNDEQVIHNEVHDYGQMHFSITEIIATCLTMFLSGIGISILWKHLLAPRVYSYLQDEPVHLGINPKADDTQEAKNITSIALDTSYTNAQPALVTSEPKLEQHAPDASQTVEANSSQNLNSQVPEKLSQSNSSEPFRAVLVELMNLSLNIWQQHTHLGKVELAEQSGIWKVTIDDGRLRTRALERYLKLERLPKNPRWREVLRTGYFVLGKLEETHEQYDELNNLIASVREAGKYQTSAATKVTSKSE